MNRTRNSTSVTPQIAGPRRRGRHRFVTDGLAVVARSALGLAVAAAAGVSTQAETLDGIPKPRISESTQPSPASPSPIDPDPSAEEVQIEAFQRRETSATSRDAVRTARVRELSVDRTTALATDRQSREAQKQKAQVKQRRGQLASIERKVAANETHLRAERRKAAEAAAAKKAKARAAAAAGEKRKAVGQEAASAPAGVEPEKAAEGAPSHPQSSSGGAASPIAGAVTGAPFGAVGSWSRYHTGIDFRAGYGTPIRAAQAGVVTFAGNSGSWAGNYVAIRHAGGESTQSSHMSTVAVKNGQQVAAGEVVGYVGNTGRSFGAHLHFELYPSGVQPGDVYRAINPRPWLESNGVTVR